MLEGERLVMDITPAPSFKRYVAVRCIASALVFIAMLNVVIAMTLYLTTGGSPIPEVGVGPLLITYAISYLALAAVSVALTLMLANLTFKKHHYWITDKRVVWRRGVIGYSITSVPLERISDVTISRTFWERLCGVSGLVIKEVGAVPKYYGYYGYSLGVFPTMIAVPNPEEVQRQILELISKKESKFTV
ncbi:PH domain-containing protein [Candidatus Bathyarchaeota archaeon]|nr:PH domain-containing protein [Candidatus Bathyarchaeota archaeon]